MSAPLVRPLDLAAHYRAIRETLWRIGEQHLAWRVVTPANSNGWPLPSCPVNPAPAQDTRGIGYPPPGRALATSLTPGGTFHSFHGLHDTTGETQDHA